MSEKIIIEKKDPIQYVRFGTCKNCRTKMALKGSLYEIEDYTKTLCENCMLAAVSLGFPHKANSRYAKRKLRKVEGNESKSKY